MHDATQRLKTLQVADVMNKELVQVSVNQSMTEAADILSRHNISTAPVIDEQGRCVGILSATDFLRRQSNLGHSHEQSLTSATHQLVDSPGEQPLHISPVAEDMVNSHMTRAVQSVGPDVSLLKAAHIMNAEHIHRLPVLDADGRAVGIVSTMDIVSSLVCAVDEGETTFARQMQDGDF